MSAKYIKINPINPEIDLVKKCASVIKKGGSVVYPTETLYGLGVDVFNNQACSKVFSIKGRDLSKPLIVHIAKIEDVYSIAYDIPENAFLLMKKYWPGPLTIVLKKNKNISDIISKNNTVGIRIPNNKIELEIIKHAKTPITGTSANLSGSDGIIDPLIVFESMKDRVDVIIDGGICVLGKQSTIIDLSNNEIKLLREGAIKYSEILDFLKKYEN